MSRHFNLGYKKPGWDTMQAGIGKPLSDAKIRTYIRAGKYPGLVLLSSKKPSTHVKSARQVRTLLDEYTAI